jgi:hypothetical protein
VQVRNGTSSRKPGTLPDLAYSYDPAADAELRTRDHRTVRFSTALPVGIPKPMTDPELIAALIERFQTTCRHPSMRPLIIHQHNSNSLLDPTTHPEVSKPGVYVHYDDADRAFYIGSSGYPCGRNAVHFKRIDARAECDLPARIDLIEVANPWEIFSLEMFLQWEIADGGIDARWNAWKARQYAKRAASPGTAAALHEILY